MDNVKIEVTIKVFHERSWSEVKTLAEANVSSKGTYSADELAAATGERIAEAVALLKSRLTPAIAEEQAAAMRKLEENRERTASVS